jgi:hypothetical protein
MTVETIPSVVIEDVLNFFEGVAAAWSEKYLSPYSVYSMFYDDAIHYWFAIGRAYARECREDDPKVSEIYKNYESLITELQRVEREKTHHATEPDAKDIRKFLEAEAELDQPIMLKSGTIV